MYPCDKEKASSQRGWRERLRDTSVVPAPSKAGHQCHHKWPAKALLAFGVRSDIYFGLKNCKKDKRVRCLELLSKKKEVS